MHQLPAHYTDELYQGYLQGIREQVDIMQNGTYLNVCDVGTDRQDIDRHCLLLEHTFTVLIASSEKKKE